MVSEAQIRWACISQETTPEISQVIAMRLFIVNTNTMPILTSDSWLLLF
jgi:hypothetical protein